MAGSELLFGRSVLIWWGLVVGVLVGCCCGLMLLGGGVVLISGVGLQVIGGDDYTIGI